MSESAFSLLRWWLFAQVLGWAAWPMAYHLFPRLADRGYAASKALGLICWAYIAWLGGTFIPASLSDGGLVTGVLLSVALFLYLGRTSWCVRESGVRPGVRWVRLNLRWVLATELVFVVAFLAWAWMRASSPEAWSSGGEKFHELAFLQSVFSSSSFPPEDPWLAGHSVNYYYFGYVLVGLIARCCRIEPVVAFNVGTAFLFALTAVTMMSVSTSVCSLRRYKEHPTAKASVVCGIIGVLLLLLLSNLQVVFELLFARGLLPSSFWTWLQLPGLSDPTLSAFGGGHEAQWHGWWWRASRLFQDWTPQGAPRVIISEFPFFSFLLGDLHPHLMALPLNLLLVAVAYQIWHAPGTWRRTFFFVAALLLGGTSFMNAWDVPTFTLLVTGVAVIGTRYSQGMHLSTWLRPVAIVLLGAVLYLPHLKTFVPQPLSLAPVFGGTKLSHFLIMFAPLLAPVTGALAIMTKNTGVRRIIMKTLIGLGLILLAAYAVWALHFHSIEEGSLASAIKVKWAQGTTAFFCALLFSWSIALLLSTKDRDDRFALWLLALAAGLLLVVEFIFVRDLFGTRMNTFFKFYFQVWLLLAIVAAWAICYLFYNTRAGGRRLLVMGWTALTLLPGFIYPVLAPAARAGHADYLPTLRADSGLKHNAPDDYALVEWLRRHTSPHDRLVEAPTTEYRAAGRISVFSGRPSLIGWSLHEKQWRGEDVYATVVVPRTELVAKIYSELEGDALVERLRGEGVDYVVLGRIELALATASDPDVETRFDAVLQKVFEQGKAKIYRVPK